MWGGGGGECGGLIIWGFLRVTFGGLIFRRAYFGGTYYPERGNHGVKKFTDSMIISLVSVQINRQTAPKSSERPSVHNMVQLRLYWQCHASFG